MHVTLLLDHACNMACTYCYAGRKFSRPMPAHVLHQAVDLAFREGPARLSFFGGEPLLRMDLVREAVRLAQERGAAEFWLTSNGLLLDDEILDFLRRENFRLILSLDGDEASHDAARRNQEGHGTYAQVRNALSLALTELPETEVSAVVGPHNVQRLARSFLALLETGCRKIHFSLDMEADWEESDLQRLESSIAELAEAYLNQTRAGRAFQLGWLDGKILSHLKPGAYSAHDRCRFGLGEVAVAPSGRLYPCERLVGEDNKDELCIGALPKGPDPERVAALRRQAAQVDPACTDCALAPRCITWCGCAQLASSGRLGRVGPLHCRLEQALITQADRVAEILWEEKNPSFVQKFYGMDPRG